MKNIKTGYEGHLRVGIFFLPLRSYKIYLVSYNIPQLMVGVAAAENRKFAMVLVAAVCWSIWRCRNKACLLLTWFSTFVTCYNIRISYRHHQTVTDSRRGAAAKIYESLHDWPPTTHRLQGAGMSV